MQPFIEVLTPCLITPPIKREPMAKHTNFRIGGPARYFAEVKTVEELRAVIEAATSYGMPWFILGGGSNTLVADDGFDGLVIKIAFRKLSIEGNRVTADAGVLSALVARQTAQAGLAGFAWAISLPGTIGGAVRGNAGCFGGETQDYLVSVQVLRAGQIITLTKADCQFAYRESAFKHNEDIILSATFEFIPGNAPDLLAELNDKLAKRKATQPLYAGSAGCLFKNTAVSDAELSSLSQTLEVPQPMVQSHLLATGWIIDKLGLKGRQIGGAKISEEHGNFVVNVDHAKAGDVAALIDLAKTETKNRFNLDLHEEVKLLGF